ncbi:hypothetical protein WJX72_001809 [[Myrmecia] bisecta]|uniref:SET domain-containing protein n=1 Tax=[Myrmecia] bisecta TaxID=41462 RepID=A0AAW1Q768_9CHLO
MRVKTTRRKGTGTVCRAQSAEAEVLHPAQPPLAEEQAEPVLAPSLSPSDTAVLPPDHGGGTHQFTGFVHRQPPLEKGERRVLGHTLSARVAANYECLQKRSKLAFITPISKQAAFTPAILDQIAKAVDECISSHMPAQVSREASFRQWLDALPADLPVGNSVEVFRIPPDDPRQGLAASGGLGLRATRPLAVGTILGPYRGHVLFQSEFNQRKRDPSPQWEQGVFAFREQMESFGADISVADDISPHCKALAKVENLTISAFMYGNETCLINDPRRSPLQNPCEKVAARAVNVELQPVLIGSWPFLFAVVSRAVRAGQELLLDYGQAYWQLLLEVIGDRKAADVDLAKQEARILAQQPQQLSQLSGSTTGVETQASLQDAVPSCSGHASACGMVGPAGEGGGATSSPAIRRELEPGCPSAGQEASPAAQLMEQHSISAVADEPSPQLPGPRPGVPRGVLAGNPRDQARPIGEKGAIAKKSSRHQPLHSQPRR